jgi:glucose-1-phosphate thymidylyltransferase
LPPTSNNAKFEDKFKDYIKNRVFKKPVKLIIEPTMGEGEKLGSVGGLRYLIEHLEVDEDVFIVGGDNIFEFNLQDFFDFYADNDSSCIALKKIDDKELIKKYGVCTVDKNNIIIEFQEKPENPKSDLASTACYLFTFNDLMLLPKYLDEGNSPDAMGSFIEWIIRNTEVYGFVFKEDWHDIGSFEELDKARKKYGGD